MGLSMFTAAGETSNIGDQIYHSLQVVLSHRLQGGLFFQASYTFGKNIDNVSGAISGDELNASSGAWGKYR